VLDIDSDSLNAFDDTDRQYLERLVSLLMQALENQ
jgi:putative methionine-R-sulfoxide reductase with GAF domain